MMGKLTGSFRYRIGFWGRLILQVEERFSAPTGRFGDLDHWTKWRDAKVGDITGSPKILPKMADEE
jgi:hypothetical protein